ncbi:MAG: bifunctional (p)ppGpp synthetase/guanosine-3',5'-bis(diphosphate) 3'-pyrophosphohydrolase [Dehalococcoidia bacterium]|nr:MAG: bifunctional (p)ppGpp synthetase/guanosine-3',5'-bis(diphosphate) 3'-pyrophosphohydrolase [Dehalococcoidia bacterium]
MEVNELIKQAGTYLPDDKVALVKAAYEFASRAHQGQVRKTGEPYLEHPLTTAMILAEFHLDAETLAAALLHDVTEDCGVPLDEIEANFGSQVGKLVDGVTKLNKLTSRARTRETKSKVQAENLRKMLLATAEDLRVVLIKLADRLHNMRTLGALPAEKRRDIAQETMEIYAPLAHRLGMRDAKWQLEDLAFRYLKPRLYHRIARLVAGKRAEREGFIAEVSQILCQELDKVDIKAKVYGRPKHIYSIYQKMGKYDAQGKNFRDIHDLFALRVLVDSVSDCYKALGVLHNLWRPTPEEFDDFIANPKDNGYQALHTTVMCQDTRPLEIQIRTHDMHRVNEYGVAAHWLYKEGKVGGQFKDEIAWLRQLGDWREELDSEEFLESVKTDVLVDRVFVYTPKGEIKELPRGATPLDFAFRIHTNLGYRCIGAKVNGKLGPLNYTLKNGDVVEIMASKVDKGPSLDWLNPELGYLKTSHARSKVRQWFNKQERSQCIEYGKQIWDRELKRLGIGLPGADEVARLLDYDGADDLFAALGSGSINSSQIMLKLSGELESTGEGVEVLPPRKVSPVSITVLGVGDLLTRLANCCHPLPGDKIIGYITQGRGITVHRRDCPNIIHEEEKERLIKVEWGDVAQVYPVMIQIDAWDRVGLVRDISAIIAEEGVNLGEVSMGNHNDGSVILYFTLEVKGAAQLSKIMSRVYSVWNVVSVTRKGEISVT